jgi:16S rRNA (cytosine967-C5)-methyltransferase
MAVAWYLVHGPDDDIFKTLNAGKISEQPQPLVADRINHIAELFPDFAVADIFQFKQELSDGLMVDDYVASMLVQPRVWIRVTKGNATTVNDDLEANAIPFEKDKSLPSAFSFEPGVKLDSLTSKQINLFEIQDRSSQIAGAAVPAKPCEHWWDCCCGAGGKSLEIFDAVPGIKITATDSRATILKNFRERTEKYHSQLSTTVVDLELPLSKNFFGSKFDGIIADVPCTGSGTWARSPENLKFFNEDAIQNYVKRQQTIIASALPFLKSNGTLVYITCSVFKAENEDMANWIAALPGMKLSESKFIDGTRNFCDSMFYAKFMKT